MYHCHACDATFEVPESCAYEYWDATGVDRSIVLLCPYCDSSDIDGEPEPYDAD